MRCFGRVIGPASWLPRFGSCGPPLISTRSYAHASICSAVCSPCDLDGRHSARRHDLLHIRPRTYLQFRKWLRLRCLDRSAPFVPSETVTLTDAVYALRQFSSSVTVYVESSSVAGPPDAILDTLTEVPNPSSDFQLVDFTCSVCPVLTAGTSYFAVAQKPFPLGFSFLDLSPAVTGTVYINEDGSPNRALAQ